MEQLRQHNAQERNLRRILRAENALLDSEKRKREDNIIKYVRNLFRYKKEINNSAITSDSKDERNLFRLKKEKEVIKDGIIKRRLKEDYYKPVRESNFWS